MNVQNGVEVGTEIHFRHAEKANKPVIFVVNGLDHEKTNFDKSIEMMKDRFGGNVTLVQFPVNEGPDFDSVIDVIKMKMLQYPKDGGRAKLVDIPAEHADKATELQSELIEKAAENDESLMEIFFENDTLTEDEMRQGIQAGLVQRGIFPVFCTAARNNIGVDRVMEFIANVAPLASDMPAWTTEDGKEVKCDPSAPTQIFVFKSAIEEHIGEINYFKVVSGTVKENLDVNNETSGTKERLSQLYVCAGKNRVKVSELQAGDIGAAVKLKNTKTNHTLNAAGSKGKFPLI